MAYIKDYWTNKESRAEQSRQHTRDMQELHKDAIEASIANTKIYHTNFECYKNVVRDSTVIIVDDADTVSAADRYSDGKTALLNFASYKNPGGMFLNGSKAQEESLCHASFLYNVLSRFVTAFYDWNNQNKNKALYLNRGLYSPNIVFQHGGAEFYCDVITCAAPNKSAAQKYQNVSDVENTKVLKSRIKYVLDIAKDNEVEVLILGAYGCGVFGQNPTEVAMIFKECLETTHKNCFSKVVFAIPSGRDGNLEAFKSVFKK